MGITRIFWVNYQHKLRIDMMQKILTFILCFCAGIALQAQGIDFHHGTWAEALAKAKAEDKLIFVDGYAVWCGPCKALAKNVFPKAEVGEFFNANFVNVKMDMEKGEGLTFRKKYPVSAFPTLYFIAPNGGLVQSTKGAPRTPEALIGLAVKATKKYDRSAEYMKKYETGDRSYETMYNLVKALNKSNKPSLQYANEYLRTQKDLGSENNLMFLFESLTQLDTRVFDQFVSYEKQIRELVDADEIDKKIETAAHQTVNNAVEFESPELLEEAQIKFTKLYPSKASAFKTESNMSYATQTKDAELFLKNAKLSMFDLAKQKEIINSALQQFPDNEKVVKSTEKWAKSVAQKEDSAGSYYLLAMTQVKLEKVNQAIKSLEKCIEKTDSEAKENEIVQRSITKTQV